jgi:hypothetical protein
MEPSAHRSSLRSNHPAIWGSLLAIDRDQRIALRNRPVLDVEERIAVDYRKEDGEKPRRLWTGSIFQGPANFVSAAVRESSYSRRRASLKDR